MENPQWVLPSERFNVTQLQQGQDEADVGDWARACSTAATAATDPSFAAVTKQQPLYNCTFKSLSSFYQIQQAIRTHGAVVTRTVVNNDFEVQFNETKRLKAGMSLPPYRYNVTAKPSFAHAALITGYDNANFTWSILNSWGKSNDAGQLRSSGITRDGMFKMQMGLAGVGTPDATYAVACYPADGTKLNLHWDQPWTRSRRRFLTPRQGDNETCYSYNIQKGDTVGGIADHFGLDMRQFVQDKQNLGVVGTLTTFKYAIGSILKEDQLRIAFNTAHTVTFSYTSLRSSMQCSFYDATGNQKYVNCTRANYKDCARPGVVGCAMMYPDVNVTAVLTPGKVVRVCNDNWSSFVAFDKVAVIRGSVLASSEIEESQAMGLLQALRSSDANVTAAWALKYLACDVNTVVVLPNGKEVDWMIRCSKPFAPGQGKANVTYLGYNPCSGPLEYLPDSVREGSQLLPSLNISLMTALMSLPELKSLDMVVGTGALLPQLGTLSQINRMWLCHFCLRGTMPASIFAGLTNLTTFDARKLDKVVGADDAVGGDCGISGTLPSIKLRGDTPSTPWQSISSLFLFNNQLTGQLPTGLLSLADVVGLANNKFSGSVPSGRGLADVVASTIYLAGNDLKGVFPKSWWSAAGHVTALSIDNNPGLSGCVPLVNTTFFTYDNTQVQGLCNPNAAALEQQQRRAISLLPELLCGFGEYNNTLQKLLHRVNNLGNLVGDGDTLYAPYEYFNEAPGPDAPPPTPPGGGVTPPPPAPPPSSRLGLVIQVFDGVEYVTSFSTDNSPETKFPIIKLQRLIPIVKQLPRLQGFVCSGCTAQPSTLQLLASLPDAAPYLKILDLDNSSLGGQLPPTWGNWPSIESISLDLNTISGTLPDRFRLLPNLTRLELSNNKFQGTLPDMWGQARVMPSSLQLNLYGNSKMQGEVPSSWVHFSAGNLNLLGTRVGGCAPNGLRVAQDPPLPTCSSVSSDAAALKAIKELLERAGLSSPGLRTWFIGGDYCNGTWIGVSCSTFGFGPAVVTGLSTTALGVQADVTTLVPLLDVVAAVSIMTHMQSLVLSDIGLSGAMHGLPSPGFEALKQLRHLDISHNPGITGNLPKNWFTLSDLQILDISYTGITGTLPAAYAALQNMHEFRAVNCTGITGQLPPAWGLLPLEVLEITNSGLSGTLPKEWTDAAAMRGAAMEVAAAMHAEALDALHDSYAGRSATIEPASLALEGLRVLDLSVSLPGKGGMSGALPEGFSTLTQLQVLMLSGHNFNGTLPTSWTRLKQLRVLDVSRNSLTGSLPSWYVSMRQLAVLKLHDNKLVKLPDGEAEFFEYRVGDGSQLVCLSVADNNDTLVNAAKAAELKSKAQRSVPPMELVINEPAHKMCDAERWKKRMTHT